MIDWLIEQQSVLSLTILLISCLSFFWSTKLGARFTYKLWLLVPFALLLNNLPGQMLAIKSEQMSRYVVGLTPKVDIVNFEPLLMIWALGAAAIVVLSLLNYRKLRASITHRHKHYPTAYYATHVDAPMLFGFVSPKILIPTDFDKQFCTQQQKLVLEHETTHFLHHDHVWNGVVLVFTTLFWFNPLVWIGLRTFKIQQELACDASVILQKSEQDKLLYAKALVQCAEHSLQTHALYSTFGDKRAMLKRLTLIKKPASTNKLIAIASIMAMSLLTANIALAKLTTAKYDAAAVNLATPVKRVDPLYPPQAVENGQEGYVVVQFDITETGSTDNLKVVESSPKGVFDRNSKKALKQWQYKPMIKGGQAMRQTGLLVQLDFKLGNLEGTNPSSPETVKAN